MLNESELATLRNRFKKDAEFLMQTSTSGDEGEKSKFQEQLTSLATSLISFRMKLSVKSLR